MEDLKAKFGVSDEHLANRMNRSLQIWIENPSLSLEKIAELAGISRHTFVNYRANPKFMEEYHRLCKEKFQAIEAEAVEQLKMLVRNGDFKAVKYALDGAGYAAEQKVNLKSDTVINIVISDEQEGE